VTHERARFLLTLFGAVIPTLTFVFILISVLLDVFRDVAAIGALVLIISALLMMVSHIMLYGLSAFWNCGECGKRYYELFMPYWPLTRTCQNCHCED